MLTRSATIKNRLICCDCGSPITQGTTEKGQAVNWWAVLTIVATLLAAMGMFIARDEFSLGTGDESQVNESPTHLE
jgi:hypothetical protein